MTLKIQRNYILTLLTLTLIIGLSTAKAQMGENNPPLDTLKNINLMVKDSLQIPDTLYDVVDLFKDINPIRNKSKENFSKKTFSNFIFTKYKL